MDIDEDFAEFTGARWGSLYRLAYLLAASSAGAEDLLHTTLTKAYGNWRRIGRSENAEVYVRRMLVATAVPSRPRAWERERTTGDVPDRSAGSIGMSALDRRLLWPIVCALPPSQRAVIVLRLYENLTEAQIADALGCARGTVRAQSAAALGSLRRSVAAASDVGEPVAGS